MPTRSVKLLVAANGFQVTTNVPNTAQTPINLNPTLEKLEGYANIAADTWLQFHDSVGAPAANAEPFRELYLGNSKDGFSWQYADDPLFLPNLQNGLYLALSSVQGTFTAAAGTATFDIELEEWELRTFGLTIAGDLQNLVQVQPIWADPGVNHKLVRLEIVVDAGSAANAYIQLHTQNPVFGLLAVANLGVVPIGTNKVFRFGTDGIPVFSQDKDGTKRSGCWVALSAPPTIPGTYDDDQLVVGFVRAFYK